MPIREMAAVRHPYLLSQVVVDRHAARHGFCDDGLHDLRRYLFTRCRVHRVHLWLHLAYNHASEFGTSELSSRPRSGYSSRSLRRRPADIAPDLSARRCLSTPHPAIFENLSLDLFVAYAL